MHLPGVGKTVTTQCGWTKAYKSDLLFWRSFCLNQTRGAQLFERGPSSKGGLSSSRRSDKVPSFLSKKGHCFLGSSLTNAQCLLSAPLSMPDNACQWKHWVSFSSSWLLCGNGYSSPGWWWHATNKQAVFYEEVSAGVRARSSFKRKLIF